MSEITLKTKDLQALVSFAVKGAGENRLLPITSMMKIETTSDGIISFTTTDSVNYLVTYMDVSDQVPGLGTNFYAVVMADKFNKLISKITSETVKLSIDVNTLHVKGNGKYKIEMPSDENGLVKFPSFNMLNNEKLFAASNVRTDVIKQIVSTNKLCLATTMEHPQLCAYYCGNSVISTNVYTICTTYESLFGEEEGVLISKEVFDLLSSTAGDKIHCDVFAEETSDYSTRRKIKFTGALSSGGYVYYTETPEGIEDFPLADISTFDQIDFENSVQIKKSELAAALERLNLFVEPYDKNGVTLSFNQDHVVLLSKRGTSEESVYWNPGAAAVEDFSCTVDVVTFTQMIKCVNSDTVVLEYGNDFALKIIGDGFDVVVGLLVEESEEF